MRRSEEFKITSNNTIYKRLQKLIRESEGKIKCSVCPYHKNENDHKKRYIKNWKRYRKTQYKL